MTYYKGLDENLCGKNDMQYEIGKEYTAEIDDAWHWLHFTSKLSMAWMYGPRIVVVEPVTKVRHYANGEKNAKTIRIVRELTRTELMTALVNAKIPVRRMIKLKPTYDELLTLPIRKGDYYYILHDFNWLTKEQRLSLIPERWRILEDLIHDNP